MFVFSGRIAQSVHVVSFVLVFNSRIAQSVHVHIARFFYIFTELGSFEIFPMELKNEFEIAVINEPPMRAIKLLL